LRLPGGDCARVLLAVAQHPERRHDLGVLLEVRARALDGRRRGVVDAHAKAQDQRLAELERAAVAARGLLVVADPALDELLGGGGDDALMLAHHEVERAGFRYDGLPASTGRWWGAGPG
jgi:hypothetical protein